MMVLLNITINLSYNHWSSSIWLYFLLFSFNDSHATGNHLSGPAMYVETSTHSMSTPLSYYSKEQETSFINRNISTARLFGRTLVSGGHTIGENHHVSPGESEIRSITHLEEVKGKKIG